MHIYISALLNTPISGPYHRADKLNRVCLIRETYKIYIVWGPPGQVWETLHYSQGLKSTNLATKFLELAQKNKKEREINLINYVTAFFLYTVCIYIYCYCFNAHELLLQCT